MHTGVSGPADGPQHLQVNLSIASFLIAADVSINSHFGFSFGDQWGHSGWASLPLYDRSRGNALALAERLGCCDGHLQPHTYMHDAEGFGDLYNTVLDSAEECAKVCWSALRTSAKASSGLPCRTVQEAREILAIVPTARHAAGSICKPSIGHIEHITTPRTRAGSNTTWCRAARKGCRGHAGTRTSTCQ